VIGLVSQQAVTPLVGHDELNSRSR